jgi:hypothetical protein
MLIYLRKKCIAIHFHCRFYEFWDLGSWGLHNLTETRKWRWGPWEQAAYAPAPPLLWRPALVPCNAVVIVADWVTAPTIWRPPLRRTPAKTAM